MAKPGLTSSLLLEQAGALLLAAGAVKRFNGSKRRAESGSRNINTFAILDECISLQRSFLQFLNLYESEPKETWQFALFYCAAGISTSLYELEHDLLAKPAPDRWFREIDQVYQLRLIWTKNPVSGIQNGSFDSWDVENSIRLCEEFRKILE